MSPMVSLGLCFWSCVCQRLGQRWNQVAAMAQLPHVQDKASGLVEETTEKLAWLPCFLSRCLLGQSQPGLEEKHSSEI